MLRPDGTMPSMREFLAQRLPRESEGAQPDMRPCFSDVVDLFVHQADGVELRAVETLLQRLVAALTPDAVSRTLSHDHPHYRAALLLHVGDTPTPAALGGVLYRRPEMPQGIGSLHVRLYLETWATARTGQVFTPQHLSSALESE